MKVIIIIFEGIYGFGFDGKEWNEQWIRMKWNKSVVPLFRYFIIGTPKKTLPIKHLFIFLFYLYF